MPASAWRTQSKSFKQQVNTFIISYWIHWISVISLVWWNTTGRCRSCPHQWPNSSLICMPTIDPENKQLCFSLLSQQGTDYPQSLVRTRPSVRQRMWGILYGCLQVYKEWVTDGWKDQTVIWRRCFSFTVSFLLASLIKSALFCGKESSRKYVLNLRQLRLSFLR